MSSSQSCKASNLLDTDIGVFGIIVLLMCSDSSLPLDVLSSEVTWVLAGCSPRWVELRDRGLTSGFKTLSLFIFGCIFSLFGSSDDEAWFVSVGVTIRGLFFPLVLFVSMGWVCPCAVFFSVSSWLTPFLSIVHSSFSIHHYFGVVYTVGMGLFCHNSGSLALGCPLRQTSTTRPSKPHFVQKALFPSYSNFCENPFSLLNSLQSKYDFVLSKEFTNRVTNALKHGWIEIHKQKIVVNAPKSELMYCPCREQNIWSTDIAWTYSWIFYQSHEIAPIPYPGKWLEESRSVSDRQA